MKISAFEHKDAALLLDLLRFFKPPETLKLCLSLPKGFEGKAPSWMEQKRDVSPKKTRVVARQNQQELEKLHQFFFCSSFRCLKIAHEMPKLNLALFGDLEPSCLLHEAKDFPDIKIHYSDLTAWLNDAPKDRLLVCSSAIILQALLINEPDDLWLLAFDEDELVLDLRLCGSTQSHHRAYRQLSAWCECMEIYDDIDRLSLSRSYENNASSYGFFAEFYDRYMSHVDYSEWIDMILSWAFHFMETTPKIVLEMACGTAKISEQLVFKGMDVDGFDASPFMLHQAYKKNFKPKLHLASLTDPPKRENHYELILCLFDSINYLLRSEEVSIAIHNAWLALQTNGLLVFDISTIYNSKENFFDVIQTHHFAEASIVHHAFYDELRLRQRSFLNLYRKGGTAVIPSQEEHCQRVYSHKEILSLIHNSPFELKGIFATEARGNLINKKMQNLDQRYPRLFYMLQKNPK